LRSAPGDAARHEQEGADQDEDLDCELNRPCTMPARRRAKNEGDQESERRAADDGCDHERTFPQAIGRVTPQAAVAR
jgi:hypothetical protein